MNEIEYRKTDGSIIKCPIISGEVDYVLREINNSQLSPISIWEHLNQIALGLENGNNKLVRNLINSNIVSISSVVYSGDGQIKLQPKSQTYQQKNLKELLKCNWMGKLILQKKSFKNFSSQPFDIEEVRKYIEQKITSNDDIIDNPLLINLFENDKDLLKSISKTIFDYAQKQLRINIPRDNNSTMEYLLFLKPDYTISIVQNNKDVSMIGVPKDIKHQLYQEKKLESCNFLKPSNGKIPITKELKTLLPKVQRLEEKLYGLKQDLNVLADTTITIGQHDIQQILRKYDLLNKKSQ